MARNPRADELGSWHHVMNRGIARRSLFEVRDDIRYFLAGLARAVRRGQLEVHAFCILTTHFHLLVCSPVGELSAAMRRVQNAYVRRFNRGRKRDGPMVRGRFRSRPVTSSAYREMLIRYIDANPVVAGLVRDPCEYPYGSASAYARAGGPPWLERTWVEELVRSRLGSTTYAGRDYGRAVGGWCPEGVQRLVERRIASADDRRRPDPLDGLVNAVPARILRWLRAKARLADGTDPGLPLADPLTVQRVVATVKSRSPAWELNVNRKARSGWELVEAGLLRDMTAGTFTEIGAWTRRSAVTAARLHRQHCELVRLDDGYGARASRLARSVLDELVGSTAVSDRVRRVSSGP